MLRLTKIYGHRNLTITNRNTTRHGTNYIMQIVFDPFIAREETGTTLNTFNDFLSSTYFSERDTQRLLSAAGLTLKAIKQVHHSYIEKHIFTLREAATRNLTLNLTLQTKCFENT